MTNILIIGANGFIGNAISYELHKNFQIHLTKLGRDQLDLSTDKILSPLLPGQFDVIVFAAARAPAKNFHDYLINLKIVNNFIALVKEFNFKYILNISSDAVYPDTKVPITEDLCPRPNTFHGLMHFSRELMLDASFPNKVGHLRSTLVYGLNDPHNGYGPNKFLRLALKNLPITINGNGEELRDHIYIDDIAKIACVMIDKSYLGPLNAASGLPITFAEIGNIIKNLVPNCTIQYARRESPIPHDGVRIFNISKLYELYPEYNPQNLLANLSDILDGS